MYDRIFLSDGSEFPEGTTVTSSNSNITAALDGTTSIKVNSGNITSSTGHLLINAPGYKEARITFTQEPINLYLQKYQFLPATLTLPLNTPYTFNAVVISQLTKPTVTSGFTLDIANEVIQYAGTDTEATAILTLSSDEIVEHGAAHNQCTITITDTPNVE